MPRLKQSPEEKADLLFQGLVAKGQKMLGENYRDICARLDISNQTYYRRLRKPGTLKLEQVRFLAQHYGWTDREWCEIGGIAYQGKTEP